MCRCKTAFLCGLAAIVLSGCNRNSMDIDSFRSMTEPGLIVKGRQILNYDYTTWQSGYNESANEFSLFSDNMSDFLVIKCYSGLRKGETVKADVRYTTVDNIKTVKRVSFLVSDIDDNSGKVWLYSSKNDICAIVMMVK